MILRRLTPDDVVAYRSIRLQALAEYPAAFLSSAEEESAEQLEWHAKRLAETNETVMLGAFVDQALIGMVGYGRNARRKVRHTGFIRAMFVTSEWQGRGIGTALLKQALAELRQRDGLRQIYLEVVAGNVAAVELYKRLGFVPYGLQPDALCIDGVFQDDMLMHLSLAPTGT